MKTRSKATQTDLRSSPCRSNTAKKRSGAARARARTLDSAAPAGVRSNLLRLLQPLARNRFIADTSRNHGANNNTPPSLLPVAPTPPAPALARRARNRFGAMGGRRADRTPSTHGFGHAVGVPGSAYPEPYSRSPNGEGEGSIGTSPPESRADARGNSCAWRQSLFARPSADGLVAGIGTPRREDATWAIVGQPVANGRVGKPRCAARFPAPPTCLAELPTCHRIIEK